MKIIISLGKTGDLISILPLAKWANDNGQRWSVMASHKYISVLEGCSYVDRIPFAGDYDDLEPAVNQAKEMSGDVRVAQVIGPPDPIRRFAYEPAGLRQATTDSFAKESWKLLGHLDKWKDGLPTVFDQRNPERESKLAVPMKGKTILVALGGVTSVFQFKPLLMELLALKFRKGYSIVDISSLKAERIYDLLGLYEKVHCLISDDSATLHLAKACPKLPVVALVNDRPSLWHGAPWQPNHIAHIRYSDFPHRATDMLSAIQHLREPGCHFFPGVTSPKIVHAWSQYEVSDENCERHKAALATWDKEYASGSWVSCPVEIGALGQDTGTTLKDDRRFPLVKDVVRLAALRSNDDDIICLTRCDTSFSEHIGDMLLENRAKLPAYAHRTLRDGSKDSFHSAVDLFAFTKRWWDDHVKEYPNMVLAMDNYWPRVLLDLLLTHGAEDMPFSIHRVPSLPIKVAPKATKRLAYNEKLAREFWEKSPSKIEPPAVIGKSDHAVNRYAIRKYGYNPSIIQHGSRLLMAYRYHPDHETQTRLAMAELDDKFNVVTNKEIHCPGRSVEDARLFLRGDGLWCSFVDSTWPETNPKCVTKTGRLTETDAHWTVDAIGQPAYPGNDGSCLQKNWVFFQLDNGAMFCIYSASPEHVVYDGTDTKHVSPAPHWPYGPIRGGTAPVIYKDKWLRFFHSGLDTEPAPWRRRYYVGALLMEPKPPYNVIAVRNEPVLVGSENDDLGVMERSGCTQYKPKVVFPAGMIETGDEYLLSVGINDAQCGIVRVKKAGLFH